MKIALIGASGSGKSELAKRLVRNLNRDQDDHKWIVIDNYVQQLEKETGCVYGKNGDYEHNVQVMSERWRQEAKAIQQGYDTITCGSIYDTIFWSALVDPGIYETEQSMMESGWAASSTMFMLGIFERRTFNYNALFYLPHEEAEEWEKVRDAKLPEVLEAMQRYYIPLSQDTPRKKITHALEVIRHIKDLASGVSSDEQPAV